MSTTSVTAATLRQALDGCPAGRSGWQTFESACVNILKFLFVPPLQEPRIQPRTFSGIDRRDAVFPSRNFEPADNNWGRFYREFAARMILVEFKNYDKTDIGKDEIVQTASYMRKPWGNLALVCCSKKPNNSAHIKRNSYYTSEGKVILFLEKSHLIEMTFIKERGDDPADLIADLIETFYLQYE